MVSKMSSGFKAGISGDIGRKQYGCASFSHELTCIEMIVVMSKSYRRGLVTSVGCVQRFG